MPSPRLQRAATARREKVQLHIREQSFFFGGDYYYTIGQFLSTIAKLLRAAKSRRGRRSVDDTPALASCAVAALGRLALRVRDM